MREITYRQALNEALAEEIALDEISTGAQNDLLRATDIARAMVTEFPESPYQRALAALTELVTERDH